MLSNHNSVVQRFSLMIQNSNIWCMDTVLYSLFFFFFMIYFLNYSTYLMMSVSFRFPGFRNILTCFPNSDDDHWPRFLMSTRKSVNFQYSFYVHTQCSWPSNFGIFGRHRDIVTTYLCTCNSWWCLSTDFLDPITVNFLYCTFVRIGIKQTVLVKYEIPLHLTIWIFT